MRTLSVRTERQSQIVEITRAVQDSNSHVNLKSKERGTPNMVLRDAGPDNPRLAPWRDQPVHFVVTNSYFLI